jgi:hypothetical protein
MYVCIQTADRDLRAVYDVSSSVALIACMHITHTHLVYAYAQETNIHMAYTCIQNAYGKIGWLPLSTVHDVNISASFHRYRPVNLLRACATFDLRMCVYMFVCMYVSMQILSRCMM